MKLDLPMMLFYLLAAAGLQTLLPPVPCEPVALKVPFLPCVALYYVLDRPWPMALTAALWAGIFTDALGGLPCGTTTLPIFLLSVAILAIRRLQPEGSLLPAVFLGPSMVMLLMLVQAIVVRRTFETPPPFLRSLKTVVVNTAIVAVISPLFVALARKLDLIAGNVEPRKEIGS